MSQPRVIFMHYLNLAKLRSSFKTNHEHSKDEGIYLSTMSKEKSVRDSMNRTTRFCCRLSTITRCVYSLI